MSTLVDFIYYKLQLSLKRRGFMYKGCIHKALLNKNVTLSIFHLLIK